MGRKRPIKRSQQLFDLGVGEHLRQRRQRPIGSSGNGHHELTNLVARHASKSQVTCDRTADRPDRAGRPITIFTEDESAHSGGVDLRQLNRSSAELLDQKSSDNMATLSPCA